MTGIAVSAERGLQTAVNLLGVKVVIQQTIPGTFDPATDSVAESKVDHSVRALQGMATRREQTDMVRAGSTKFTVVPSALGVGIDPKASWRVIVGSRTYEVVSVSTEALQGRDISHVFFTKGAG